MTGFRIVAATKRDLAAVARLAHLIWHSYYPGIISEGQIAYMLERGYAQDALEPFLGAAGSGLMLAEADGEPIGFAAWYQAEEPATTKLDKLYVVPSRHGQGAGRALVACVEDASRAFGSRQLILNVNKRNERAIAAYLRCGFEVREAVVIDIGGGFVMDDYVMAKRLDATPA